MSIGRLQKNTGRYLEGVYKVEYRLSRRIKGSDTKWLSCTVGDLKYIMSVIELNLTSPELKDFEYKVGIESFLCEKCGTKEDEILVETSKDGILLKLERLCKECSERDLEDEAFEEKWAEEKLNELFEVERFKEQGKENDHVFQALVFLGKASHQLSIARTILKNNNVAVDPVKMKEMLDMQQWVHDFSQYLRSIEERSK